MIDYELKDSVFIYKCFGYCRGRKFIPIQVVKVERFIKIDNIKTIGGLMNKQFYLVIIIIFLLAPIAAASFRTYIVPDNTITIINNANSSVKTSDYQTFIIKPSGSEQEMLYPSAIIEDEPEKKSYSEKRPLPAETSLKKISALSTSSSTLNLYNNVLNISINEKNSGSNVGSEWKYLYDGIEWGNSNFYEFYMLSSNQTSLISSDKDLTITKYFTDNSATLSYPGYLDITRTVNLPPGDQRYFEISYSIRANQDLTNIKFFQIVDFDVPDTNNSHEKDDDAEYDSFNDYIVVKDDKYFQDGFKADMRSAKHGIEAYQSISYDEWRIEDLDDRSEFNGSLEDDPVIGMQYNLGDLKQGQEKTITFTFWFGQPTGFLTKEVSIYPGASFNQQTKLLRISAYIFDNNLGEKVTTGTVNYAIYNSSDVQKESGSLIYNQTWQKNIDFDYSDGNYYAKVTYGNYEESADFSIVRGYGNIQGDVLLQDNSTVSGANVILYRTSAYFYGYSAKDFATSNSTGFSFANITPGSYLIYAVDGSNTGKTLSFSMNGKDDITKNVTIGNNTKLNFLSPYMKQLSNKIAAQMIHETDLIYEISQRAKDDLGQSLGAWDVVDFASDVITGGSGTSLVNAIANSAGRAGFSVLLENLVQYTTNKKINKLISDNEKKETLNWIIGGINGIERFPKRDLTGDNGFKSQPPWTNSFISLINQHNNFQQSSDSAGFDFNKASEVISSQINQLDSARNGKVALIVTPDSVQADSLTLPETYRKYMANAAVLSALGSVGKVLSTIKLAGGTVSLITTATGVGAPVGAAAATIATATSAPKALVGEAEMKRKAQGSLDFVGSALSWVNDIQFMPNIYNNTAEFLEEEADSAYYLNNSKNFDADITINLNPDDIIDGLNIINITTSTHKEKEATINVTNTGDDSFVRVTSEGLWDYNLPNVKLPLIGDIFGNVDYITIPTGLSYFNQSLNTNQQVSKNLDYSAFFYDPVNMFNPHILNVNVFNGPFMVKSSQEFYYPIPILLKPFVSSSLKGRSPLAVDNERSSKEEFGRLVTKAKALSVSQITNETDVIKQINYSAGNISAVQFLLFYPPGADVDLHVYDSSKRHIGYNRYTDSNEKGFPASYSGKYSNPEIIYVPDAANKNYSVVAELASHNSNLTPFVNIYALEIPFRPAVLAATPVNINKSINETQNLELSVVIGEAGCQKPLRNVSINISNLSYNGEDLNFVSPMNYSVPLLPACTSQGVDFEIEITDSDASGNYTGHITLDSADTSAQTIDVLVEFVKATSQDNETQDNESQVNETQFLLTGCSHPQGIIIINEGDSLLFSVNFSETADYKWILNNQTAASGTGDSISYHFSADYESAGNYSLRLLAGNTSAVLVSPKGIIKTACTGGSNIYDRIVAAAMKPEKEKSNNPPQEKMKVHYVG